MTKKLIKTSPLATKLIGISSAPLGLKIAALQVSFAESICIEIGSAEHAIALADCLEGTEEATLGPSDVELCVKALRELAAVVDEGPV